MLRRRLCLLRAYRCRLDDLEWRTASSEKEESLNSFALLRFAFQTESIFGTSSGTNKPVKSTG
jgi:hypothetical protein